MQGLYLAYTALLHYFRETHFNARFETRRKMKSCTLIYFLYVYFGSSCIFLTGYSCIICKYNIILILYVIRARRVSNKSV